MLSLLPQLKLSPHSLFPVSHALFSSSRSFLAEKEEADEEVDFLKNQQRQNVGDKTQRGVFFDFQSTTPMDPRVLDKMLPFMTQEYGNPHSRTHEYGWNAQDAVEDARAHIASLMHADPREITFTSGATESNNTALKGVAHFYKQKKNHIITVQTEHKCILQTARHLEDEGFKVTYMKPKKDGLIDLEELDHIITPKTSLVSIMAVNNEIGVIQPLKEIGKICRKHGALFHTDAAQGYGKIPINVNEMNIDLMSVTGHKIYGPKGIGALYVRRKKPRVKITPLIDGGGQERGRRSGTLATPLCVGFGEAARLAKVEMERDRKHVEKLSKRFYDRISSKIDLITLNGTPFGPSRFPGNVNVSFAAVEGESLIMALKDIAVSSGSACTSSSLEGSYVLKALGIPEENAHTSIRFGVGRFTTEGEVDYVCDKLIAEIGRLRELSPIYEMMQEGIDLSKIKWSEH